MKATDNPKEKGNRGKARERKVRTDPREDIQENRKVRDTMDSAGRAAGSHTSHPNLDGESPKSMKKMQTAEKAEDNLNQKKMEKSEESDRRECGGARTNKAPASIIHTVRWKKTPAEGADPSSGQVKIEVMNYM